MAPVQDGMQSHEVFHSFTKYNKRVEQIYGKLQKKESNGNLENKKST
jgi:hypothetical protein